MDKKTILIVDDEPDVREVLSKALIAEGYSILTADNGKDALMITRQELPDIVILDLLMPDISGGSVGLTLKEEPLTKEIPIIFLSCTFAEKGSLHNGPLFAGNVRLAKPYDMVHLLKAVKQQLQKNHVHH